MPQVDEDAGGLLDEPGRPADEAVRAEVGRPPVRVEVDDRQPAGLSRLSVGRLAGVEVSDVQAGVGAAQFLGVVAVGRRPYGVDEPDRRTGPAWRWERTIAMSGTMPEPPATSSTGAGSTGRQTNQPPTGPRISTGSPGERTSVR